MRIGIQTAESDAFENRLADALADAETENRAVDSDADLLVTVGEAAVVAAAHRNEERPLLPVGLTANWQPTDSTIERIVETINEYDAGSLETVPYRPLSLTVGSEQATVISDCSLLTTQPARISEYAVQTKGRTLTTFRADGVVIATPLGSAGYGRAAGGPRLGPETGLAVVPIAPFATKADRWVVRPPLTVTVERDDDITVFADSTAVTAGGVELTVDLAYDGRLSVIEYQSVSTP